MKTTQARIRAGRGVSIEEAVARVQEFISAGRTGGTDSEPKFPGKSTGNDGLSVSCLCLPTRLAFRVEREPKATSKK